jgi:hypothetical protein
MRGRGLLLGIVVASIALVWAAPALADPSVTISPPSGPAVHPSLADFRTTETQPTLAIVGTDGSQLTCNLDNAESGGEPTYVPCGPSPSTCSGSVCANFQPATPLANGVHQLVAQLDGGAAQAFVQFTVDLTPPQTLIDQQSGTVLRPVFSFFIHEDDQFDRSDSAQCSLTRLGAPTAWRTCASNLGGGFGASFRSPAELPARHVDYRFQVRAVDDFGRADPTPAATEFDPVPCAVTARSISIARLISTGIPVTLNCSYAHKIILDFFFLGANGRRVPIGTATNNYPNLGYQRVGIRKTHFTAHTTLRMFADNDPYFRTYRSAALVVRVQEDSSNDGLPGYAVITVHR